VEPAIAFSNLTEETAQYFRDSLSALERTADTWPVILASRATRDETAIGGPVAGTIRYMLVCARHTCHQCIYVLGQGTANYSSNAAGIRSNVAAHIKQCHEEEING
jgi:hypothetical protein